MFSRSVRLLSVRAVLVDDVCSARVSDGCYFPGEPRSHELSGTTRAEFFFFFFGGGGGRYFWSKLIFSR